MSTPMRHVRWEEYFKYRGIAAAYRLVPSQWGTQGAVYGVREDAFEEDEWYSGEDEQS